jgi:hypothetical protein
VIKGRPPRYEQILGIRFFDGNVAEAVEQLPPMRSR